jgi:hypothetical protein
MIKHKFISGLFAIFRSLKLLIFIAVYSLGVFGVWRFRALIFSINNNFFLNVVTATILFTSTFIIIVIIGIVSDLLPEKARKISLKSKKLVDKMINLLCVGKTGSGKSYAMTAILYLFVKYRNANITICDFKKSSFAQFEDSPNFYGYEDVPQGIRKFYEEFDARLKANDEERNKQIHVLLIDEYGALISSREKKEADELKTKIANMLFMGRSLGMVVLIGIQRADSEHFKAGARDQFAAILALGNLSKEQKSMLFTDYKDEMSANNRRGRGYLLIDGKGIERVKIAKIRDFDALNESIRKGMQR